MTKNSGGFSKSKTVAVFSVPSGSMEKCFSAPVPFTVKGDPNPFPNSRFSFHSSKII